MIYADTSFFVSLRIPDEKSQAADDFITKHPDADIIWSPLNRVESFNTIRQLAYRKAISAADARAAVHRLDRDVKAGYFHHQEADWRNVLRRTDDISQNHGFTLRCRFADLLHVAYAIELAASQFVSCDRDQIELAKAAGLKTTLLY
jgi:predicted nucleic acid-binding protein